MRSFRAESSGLAFSTVPFKEESEGNFISSVFATFPPLMGRDFTAFDKFNEILGRWVAENAVSLPIG